MIFLFVYLLIFSFFFLQEKMKSKNKLVPRLLGITKESVMRVDEKTKDVVQEWPLTTVKRWAASPKSFTLVSDTQKIWEENLPHLTAQTQNSCTVVHRLPFVIHLCTSVIEQTFVIPVNIPPLCQHPDFSRSCRSGRRSVFSIKLTQPLSCH